MSQKTFEFLTKEDFALLVENAVRLKFQKEELILEEGSRRQAIFVILSGKVKIESRYAGKQVQYVTLGPGQIFGEMSFVENQGASATVIADDFVELDLIEGYHVNALLASVPGFGTRFYQSLALILANRLRTTSKMLPSLLVDDAPKASQHIETPVTIKRDDLPPKLMSEALNFRRELLKVDRALKEREIKRDSAAQRIKAACNGIINLLSKMTLESPNLSQAVGGFVFRETFPFFVLSKRFDRLYTKPGAYASDYNTTELLCGGEPEGTGRLGTYIDEWIMELPFCGSFSDRRTRFGMLIKDKLRKGSCKVVCLAGGTCRELLSVIAEFPSSHVHGVCIDEDPEAINAATEIADQLNIRNRLDFYKESPTRLVLGKTNIRIDNSDVIYVPYLIDYLDDDHVIRILTWMINHLTETGTAGFAGFHPNNPNKNFMDYILDWHLIHRSETEIKNLCIRSGFKENQISIEADKNDTQRVVTLKLK